MSNGYELRAQLLSEARDFLLHGYFHAVEAERHRAELMKTAMQTIALPNQDEILALATKWYSFVQTKTP